MEQAYNGIKAYHGTLEVVLNNEAGKEQIQSILNISSSQLQLEELPLVATSKHTAMEF